MAVSLPIPDTIPQLYVVLLQGDPPGEEVLRESVQGWVEARLHGHLGLVVPRFLDEFVQFEPMSMADVPLPPLPMLRYLGLGAEEGAVFRAADHALVISGADVPLAPRVGYWATACATRAVARLVGGVIFDPDQRRIRPLAEHVQGPPPEGTLSVREHILVPTSRCSDGNCWMTTLGLNRLGLPNLQLRGVPHRLLPEADRLISAVAQALVEGLDAHALARVATPMEIDVLEVGAATLARAIGAPVQGDGTALVGLSMTCTRPREPLVSLHPPSSPEGDLGCWLVAAMDALQGPGDQIEVRARSLP